MSRWQRKGCRRGSKEVGLPFADATVLAESNFGGDDFTTSAVLEHVEVEF